MKQHISILIFCLLCPILVFGQDQKLWKISGEHCIVLKDSASMIAYEDNIEMSGRRISAIIDYKIDSNLNLSISKDLIFPQLRTYNKSNEPDWKKYRAYFRKQLTEHVLPVISSEDKVIVFSKIDSIEISGILRFHYQGVNGLKLIRSIYPSMEEAVLMEEWELYNYEEEAKQLKVSNVLFNQSEFGYKGEYMFSASSHSDKQIQLEAFERYTFPIYFQSHIKGEDKKVLSYEKIKKSRFDFLKMCQKQLMFHSPDPMVNLLFYFSKIRANESIFDSSMGLVHSPGGGNYYVGIWANDQVEYSGPFFPYMGYDVALTAAYNAYNTFLKNIPSVNEHIAYAFEVDGHFPMTHLDRGDAAMIAYGTSLFALNTGDKAVAELLWPLIEWSLSYCESMKNDEGAVESESDEMEGRIETGTANLSTSCLYYGGLKYASIIASEIDLQHLSIQYEKQRVDMERVIETYFGSKMEGLETYKYFAENKHLRHWICLPLVMGIDQRKEGTITALFDKLWTDNGVQVQYNPDDPLAAQRFWDRATLYALRGAFISGASERAYTKLINYSQKRLLGDHVPYPVEAYPENNMKHLSAESALYCRVILEGIFGFEPKGFSKLGIKLNIPENWKSISLKNIHLLGNDVDVNVEVVGEKYQISISSNHQEIVNELIFPDEELIISLD